MTIAKREKLDVKKMAEDRLHIRTAQALALASLSKPQFALRMTQSDGDWLNCQHFDAARQSARFWWGVGERNLVTACTGIVSGTRKLQPAEAESSILSISCELAANTLHRVAIFNLRWYTT